MTQSFMDISDITNTDITNTRNIKITTIGNDSKSIENFKKSKIGSDSALS